MDEQLVEAVRSFPCLWQVSSKSYKDLRAKENAWKEVASKDCTVEFCSRRWKTLRDRFVRELKKTKGKKSGDPGPVIVSCWPLFELMKFVSDTVKHKSTASNFSPSVSASPTPTPASVMSSAADDSISPSDADDDQPVVVDSVPGPSNPPGSPKRHRPHKRKRETELDPVDKTIMDRLENFKKEDQQDDAAAFGNHVAARLRTCSPRQYAIACLQIEKVLVDTQFPPDTDSYSISSPHTSDYFNF